MEQRTIFFNEELHKYTDEFNNVYTSTTTLIGQYEEKFDVDKMARACYKAGLKGNEKYKGKSEKQLKAEWAAETKRACDKGTVKHNFLETVVKNSNNYNKVLSGTDVFINDRLFTLDDISFDNKIGLVDLDYFTKSGLKEMYPTIYETIERAVNKGYKIYSEIGVYSPTYIVSGLIDILVLNPNTKEFIILDWKTNKAPLRFDAGYFKKDNYGNLTDEYINQFKYFFHPLNNVEASVGNHYTLQLSMYDYLAEGFGYICKGNILCHIKDICTSTIEGPVKVGEEVKFYPIPYWRDKIHALVEHHKANSNLKKQYKLI